MRSSYSLYSSGVHLSLIFSNRFSQSAVKNVRLSQSFATPTFSLSSALISKDGSLTPLIPRSYFLKLLIKLLIRSTPTLIYSKPSNLAPNRPKHHAIYCNRVRFQNLFPLRSDCLLSPVYVCS